MVSTLCSSSNPLHTTSRHREWMLIPIQQVQWAQILAGQHRSQVKDPPLPHILKLPRESAEGLSTIRAETTPGFYPTVELSSLPHTTLLWGQLWALQGGHTQFRGSGSSA